VVHEEPRIEIGPPSVDDIRRGIEQGGHRSAAIVLSGVLLVIGLLVVIIGSFSTARHLGSHALLCLSWRSQRAIAQRPSVCWHTVPVARVC
jgi:hypothetical protein